MQRVRVFLRNYASVVAIIAGIAAGTALGAVLGPRAQWLKPFGDIYLNLLLTAVVPMVFFSMASAVASMTDIRRLGKIMGWMLLVFVVTGIISSVLMIVAVKAFLPSDFTGITLGAAPAVSTNGVADQVVRAFSAPDFPEILSKKNMLALIVFSILLGLAAASSGVKGEAFRRFLESGNAVMGRLIALIMLYAPIGLGAYFGYLVGVFGPQLLGSYGRAMAVYYPAALFYFVMGFSVYAWLAAGMKGVRTFWANIIPTALTAWGTGSSVATIPTNLAAAEKIGVPRDVREVVIPLGATIHMDGSCLAAILKIAALFSFFGMPFDGLGTFAGAIAIAILAGTVISGIPSGGMLGEILILTIYGFPIGALPLITMIGTLVDPPATMVNATANNVASMVVARAVNGKKWMLDKGSPC